MGNVRQAPRVQNGYDSPAARWRRLRALFIVLATGLALSSAGFIACRRWQALHLESDVRRLAEVSAEAIRRQLVLTAELLYAIEQRYAANYEVTREHFRSSIQGALARRPELRTLEWVPRITSSQREIYEGIARDEGVAAFRIVELGVRGELVSAASRQEHLPSFYVEPPEQAGVLLGFDHAADPARLMAIQRARDTGQPTATSPVSLLRVGSEPEPPVGILIYLPVYRRQIAFGAVDQRRKELLGVVAATIRLDRLIEAALASSTPEGTELFLADQDEVAAKRGRAGIFHWSKPHGVLARAATDSSGAVPLAIQGGTAFEGAGRTWSLSCRLRPASAGVFGSTAPWVVLMAGLALTGLASGMLCRALNRAERLADERAAALRRLQDALERELAERHEAEQALTQLAALIDASPDAIITMTSEGNIVSWNAGAQRMYGYPPAEMQGCSAAQLEPDAPDGWAMVLERTAQGHTIEEREAVHRKKNGAAVHVTLTLWPVRDAGGGVTGGCVMIRDVTLQKRIQGWLAAQDDVMRILAGAETLAEAAPQILRTVCARTGWDAGAIWRVDRQAKALRCVDVWFAASNSTAALAADIRASTTAPGVGWLGQVWVSGKPAWFTTDRLREEDCARWALSGLDSLRGRLGSPIAHGGEVLGVLELLAHEPPEPSPEVSLIAGVIGMLIGQFAACQERDAQRAGSVRAKAGVA